MRIRVMEGITTGFFLPWNGVTAVPLLRGPHEVIYQFAFWWHSLDQFQTYFTKLNLRFFFEELFKCWTEWNESHLFTEMNGAKGWSHTYSNNSMPRKHSLKTSNTYFKILRLRLRLPWDTMDFSVSCHGIQHSIFPMVQKRRQICHSLLWRN